MPRVFVPSFLFHLSLLFQWRKKKRTRERESLEKGSKNPAREIPPYNQPPLLLLLPTAERSSGSFYVRFTYLVTKEWRKTDVLPFVSKTGVHKEKKERERSKGNSFLSVSVCNVTYAPIPFNFYSMLLFI